MVFIPGGGRKSNGGLKGAGEVCKDDNDDAAVVLGPVVRVGVGVGCTVAPWRKLEGPATALGCSPFIL